jgi:hypothetical protein
MGGCSVGRTCGLATERLAMSRIWIGAVCAALLLALGFGALQAGAAKRHSHRNKVVYRSASTTLAPNGVQFVTAFCPAGYKAVGGGGDAVGISLSNGTEINSSSYTTWWIANSSQPDTVRARVACLRTRTSAVRAASTASLERQLERKRRALQAKLGP